MHDALVTSDILHIVCDSLELKDVRRFRQCCKAWADIGACYAFRNISFYLHKGDLDMLKSISLNENAAKNVRSLTYFGAMLGSPKKTFEEYYHHYTTHIRSMDKMLAKRPYNRPAPPKLKMAQLKVLYQRYEAELAQQDQVLESELDFQVIKNAVARFPALRLVTMSTDQQFLPQINSKSPFNGYLVQPRDDTKPKGCRHLDSLLSGIASAGTKLEGLRAGCVGWRFFDKEPAAMGRAIAPCFDLKSLELVIDTGFNDVPISQTNDDCVGTEVPQCRRVMEANHLRDFIASLDDLTTLTVQFTWHSEKNGYPASLENIMVPKHRWQHLERLSLSNIICERQDLGAVMRRHKSTLKVVELQDIRLRSTSWLVLIPQIRKTLDLDNALICGDLYGCNENTQEDEKFVLEPPDCAPDELREDIADYLCGDGGSRCPLTYRDNTLSDEFVEHD